jgi:hypothetical protein
VREEGGVTDLREAAEAQRRSLKYTKSHSYLRSRREARSLSKLTEEDARLIRALHAEGKALREKAKTLTLQAIADKFEVSERAIWNVVNGRTWRDIGD